MLVDEDYDTDEVGDIFAQDASVHPAFRDSMPIALDVYEKLFDRFLTCELFDSWLHHKECWQLHVVGGPGSGKVTSIRYLRMLLINSTDHIRCRCSAANSEFLYDFTRAQFLPSCGIHWERLYQERTRVPGRYLG